MEHTIETLKPVTQLPIMNVPGRMLCLGNHAVNGLN